VEKRSLLTVSFISVLLLSVVAGTQLVILGKANPFSQANYSGEMHAPPSVTPPSITVLNPLNDTTYNENDVILAFDAVVGQAPSSLPYLPAKVFKELALTEVYFEADWMENKTVVNGTSRFSYAYDKVHGSIIGSYSCNLKLKDIPEGNHSITIKATERGYYYLVVRGVSFEYYGYSKSSISSVNFIVDSVPIVSFLSFENKTFDASDVPLNFTVNQAVSQIVYCFDGQENVTISGNTTLTELPNGEHNVTVYVTDDTGNTGASETVIFNVDVPEPPEPFPTALVTAASGTSFVSIGILVYFKKRKHQAENELVKKS
jgi:hypothetical protein